MWGGGKCEEIAITPEGDSLGAVYTWVTFGMGFVPLEHEYKLMGMGPYASDRAAEETAKVFHRYLRLRADGLAFQRGTRRQTHFIHECLERDLRGMRFDYICAGLQRFTEDLLCDWVQHAVRTTGVRKVLAAGGVFMNVKANKRIAELPEVDSFEAFPSCGDETLSIGAYYLEAAKRFGDATVKPLEHFYLGDAPQEADVLAAVKKSGFHYERPADMADAVAELLAEGHPVARCAGPMEFGARALGNRSILADPEIAGRRARHQSHGQEARLLDAVCAHGQGGAAARLHPESQEPAQPVHDDDVRHQGELPRPDRGGAQRRPDLPGADPRARAEPGDARHPQRVRAPHRRRRSFSTRRSTCTAFRSCARPKTPWACCANSGLEYLQVGDYLVHKRSAAASNGAASH